MNALVKSLANNSAVGSVIKEGEKKILNSSSQGLASTALSMPAIANPIGGSVSNAVQSIRAPTQQGGVSGLSYFSNNDNAKIVSRTADNLANNICRSSGDTNIAKIFKDQLVEIFKDPEYNKKIQQTLIDCIKRIILDLNGNKVILSHLLMKPNVEIINVVTIIFNYVVSTNKFKNKYKSDENFVELFISGIHKVLNSPSDVLALIESTGQSGIQKGGGGGDFTKPSAGGDPSSSSNVSPVPSTTPSSNVPTVSPPTSSPSPSTVLPVHSTTTPSSNVPTVSPPTPTPSNVLPVPSTTTSLSNVSSDSSTIPTTTPDVSVGGKKTDVDYMKNVFDSAINSSPIGSSIKYVNDSVNSGITNSSILNPKTSTSNSFVSYPITGITNSLIELLKDEILSQKSGFYDKMSSGVEYAIAKHGRQEIVQLVINNMNTGFNSVNQSVGNSPYLGNVFLCQLLSYEMGAFGEAITRVLEDEFKKNEETIVPKAIIHKKDFSFTVCTTMRDILLKQMHREDNPDAYARVRKTKKTGGRSTKKLRIMRKSKYIKRRIRKTRTGSFGF